jgi:hypothetical protein
LQAAQPLAAKLLSGAQNASFQANATRDAARQAMTEAQQKLAALRDQLKAAKSTRNAAKQALIGAPAQWGKAQFRVSRGTECGDRMQTACGNVCAAVNLHSLSDKSGVEFLDASQSQVYSAAPLQPPSSR